MFAPNVATTALTGCPTDDVCRYQVSVMAGTVLYETHVPLTQQKSEGFSSTVFGQVRHSRYLKMMATQKTKRAFVKNRAVCIC